MSPVERKMTFKVGDIIYCPNSRWQDMGNGEVLGVLSSETLAVRFDSYDEYDDDAMVDEEDYPEYPDFHYVDIKSCAHVYNQYNPEQTGDTEDDI